MPLTAPIRPSAERARRCSRWIVRSAASTRSGGTRSPRPVASAYHWPASWSAMTLSELGPVAAVVGVVVAAPQPAVEGDLAALEPARPAARGLVVARAAGPSPRRPRRRAEPERPAVRATARASATCRRSGRGGRRARAGRRRRGRSADRRVSTASTVGHASRISASPAAGPAATASRHAWRTNLGPRSFQSLTSWNGTSSGGRTGRRPGRRRRAARSPPTLRGAVQPGRLDRHDLRVVDRDRLEQVADAAQLELREQLEQGERGVEVDVDGVVEGVVDALEEREPADVVGLRLRAADLAGSQNEPPSTRKYSSLNSAARVPVRARRVVEDTAPARPRWPVARPAPRRGRAARGPTRARRSAPSPRVALPPAPSGAELDDRQVPGDREPDRPALARGEHRGRRDRGADADRRPIAAATARRRGPAGRRRRSPPTGPRSATGSNAGARCSSTPSPPAPRSTACRAGRSARRRPASPSSTASASRPRPPRGAGRGGGRTRAANGSAQVNRSPTVNGSGPGFSTHHSKTPTGRALRSRSRAMTGRQLLADEAHAARTSGSNACHARGNSAWYVPPPTGRSQPHAGSSAGRSADRTVARGAVAGRRRTARSRRRRPARGDGGRPRGASARRRRGTCGRCSRCRDRRSGTPANSPSSRIGRSTRGVPDVVARDADPAPPGRRDRRPVGRAAEAGGRRCRARRLRRVTSPRP